MDSSRLSLISLIGFRSTNFTDNDGIRNMRHAGQFSVFEDASQTRLKMEVRLKITTACNKSSYNRTGACLRAQSFDTPP